MNKRIFAAIMVMAGFLILSLFSPVVTQATDPGCTNGDCPPDPDPGCTNGDCPPDPDPGCTNGDCNPLPDPGCTNGDCNPPPDPGCTNGDCPPDPGCTNGDCPPDPGCTNGDCSLDQDGDNDNYTAQHDCDDNDSSIHPFAPEICDGKDNNCNGYLGLGEEDVDGDGYLACEDDCDDTDSSIYPGAQELCDGKDNDCDDSIPLDETDADSDGFMVCEGDCDDADAEINPDAYELTGNVVDENCDGSLGECDPEADWKNHGQFVRCVVHETDALIDLGVLTEEEGHALISAAAQSDVGNKIKKGKKKKKCKTQHHGQHWVK